MEHATTRETKGPERPAAAGPRAQRSAERAPEDARAAGLAVREVLAAPGEPMDDLTRARMEQRFGRDFSTVRVHSDSRAARSASLLSARAYTVGEHVAFGAGQYAPASRTGARLLAHELAHVLQQRAGPVDGRALAPEAGVKVSDPSDRHERAAETAARTMAPPVAGGPPSATRAAGVVAQRFQAGEDPTAHGGMEEAALRQAGFSQDEAKLAYYGNWLRDMSQLADNWFTREIIAILATGAFGRAPSKSELGSYLPSEHLDRPAGGQSAEDPLLSAGERAKAAGLLSPEQQEWVSRERPDPRFAADKKPAPHELPPWIEAGKEHARLKLREAVILGRNDRGLMALGNALHAVEDYFAHSNFVEVALGQLRHARAGRPAGRRRGPVPEIVTGSVVPDGNKAVSIWQVLQTEIKTGELSSIFAKGFIIRYGWRGLGGLGRGLLGAVGGAVGAVGGTVIGAVGGAAAGAARGWSRAGNWWQRPFAALGGLFSGLARGAAAGASRGWRAGQDAGGALGQGLFGVPGAVLTAAVITPIITAADFLLAGATAALARSRIRAGTRKSITKTPASARPTHAQLAKDAPDHPLFPAARALAQAADLAIGRAMALAWAGSGPPEDRAKHVEALVDRYVAHPGKDDWWEPVLRPFAHTREAGHGGS